jgi:hypothetical protein
MDAKWAEEVRPTLHFCITPRPDNDRLGLPDPEDDKIDAGSCYQRALAMIRGRVTEAPETPDLGLEWRLVPVGAKLVTPDDDHADEGAVDDAPGVRWGKSITMEMRIHELLGLGPRAAYALHHVGVLTIADAAARPEAELLRVPGVGPKTMQVVRRAILHARCREPRAERTAEKA